MLNKQDEELELDFLDNIPEGSTNKKNSDLKQNKTPYDTKGLTLRQKLEVLNELLVESCIENLSSGKMKPNDLGSIVTLLKNNKVIEIAREESESDIIEGLIK